ncbi:hypothetical protein GCM10012275_60470 [Longimycelium tulufanense]|uniref:GGDEF domain-containing protein n=1 Tax=Longimycelium tulufanense TaxID=907463 RepID=A0A8J3CEH1_9PSEU|nr:GGDEF domain-containing protein [Longimycelium tulufanense]GGM81750.1 hypothetical protein GCM10012275_60470 [Longimycelium tulufanense]
MHLGAGEEVGSELCCAACGQPLGYRTTDRLTGLLDRWGWEEQVTQALAESADDTSVLLLLDLDHFKDINDMHGHLAGDTVLQAVATTLKTTVRTTDLAGRFGGYGGDEFLILLPATSLEHGIAVARRIRARLQDQIVPTHTVHGQATVITGLTASIGMAVHGPHANETMTELLRRADGALLHAKRTGRNRIALGDDLI